MKEACAKCASMETRLTPTTPSQLTTTNRPSTAVNNNKDGVVDPENSLYANQQSFDAEKLHQAILAYRPVGELINLNINFIQKKMFLFL